MATMAVGTDVTVTVTVAETAAETVAETAAETGIEVRMRVVSVVEVAAEMNERMRGDVVGAHLLTGPLAIRVVGIVETVVVAIVVGTAILVLVMIAMIAGYAEDPTAIERACC